MGIRIFIVGALLLVCGCASFPTGPTAVAYPGTGKSFDQFRGDEAGCRDYALAASGGKTPQQAANNSAVEGAVVGTALGAAAGALIGGGRGAGVGAGTGLLVGSAVGANNGSATGYRAQERYDAAYLQCMYEKGDKVPVTAGFMPPPGAVYASPYAQP